MSDWQREQRWTAGVQPYKLICGCELRVGPNWVDEVRCWTHATEAQRKMLDSIRPEPPK